MQVDTAQVGEEAWQDVFTVLNGRKVVVGHDQRVQAGEHGAKLADLGPVLEAVVGDVEQAQGGAGHAGGTHTAVLVKAQEQLLQTAGGSRVKKERKKKKQIGYSDQLKKTTCVYWINLVNSRKVVFYKHTETRDGGENADKRTGQEQMIG